MRVSKTWYDRMSDPAYWTSLSLTKHISRRRMTAVRFWKALEYAQQGLLHIEIKQFPLLCQRLLQCLEAGPAGHHLKSLTLIRVEHDSSRLNNLDDVLSLKFCANTLEYLEIENWRKVWLPAELPVLKTLRTTDSNLTATRCPQLRVLEVTTHRNNGVNFPLTLPPAQMVKLSFRPWCGCGSCDYRYTDNSTRPLSDMHMSMLEELDLHMSVCWIWSAGHDRFYQERRRRSNFEILEHYGRSLASLTLRNVFLTQSLLETIVHRCPSLTWITIVESCVEVDLMPFCQSIRLWDANPWAIWEVKDWEDTRSCTKVYCTEPIHASLRLHRNNWSETACM